MELKTFRLLFPVVLVSLIGNLSADRKEDVVMMAYEGVVTYHAVDRALVQEKLDDFHEKNGLSLFLPDTAIFPEILPKGQHVVYVDFGVIEFSDFANYRGSNLSVLTPIVGLTIPFLTSHPGGPPQYELAIGLIYQRGSREFANPNFGFPNISIDELTLRPDGAVLRNGVDEMIVALEADTDPCIPSAPTLRFEFSELIQENYHVGRAEPAFGICNRFPDENRFCSSVDKIREDVAHFGSNFCQTRYLTKDMVSCKASAKVHSITTGFQDLLLFGDDSHDFFATEFISGNFTIGIEYPCLMTNCGA